MESPVHRSGCGWGRIGGQVYPQRSGRWPDRVRRRLHRWV